MTINFQNQTDFRPSYDFKTSANNLGKQAEYKFEDGLVWDAIKMSKTLKPMNWKLPPTAPENIIASKSGRQRSFLKSGRSKVKKGRGYCTTLLLTPMSSEFHMKVSFNLINSKTHMVVLKKTQMHIFSEAYCNEHQDTWEFKKKYAKHTCLAENVETEVEVKIYLEKTEETEAIFEIFRGTKLLLKQINFTDCSLDPKQRGKAGKPSTTVANTTTKATTTTTKATSTEETTTTRRDLKYWFGSLLDFHVLRLMSSSVHELPIIKF